MKEVTRERLEEIVSDQMISQCSEFAMMARMALAAMDSEPVAYRWNYGGTTTWRLQDTKPGPGSNPRCPRVIEPLYRHAQPAPEVPEEMLCDFYEVNNWTDLVRELVKHVEQLQDSARRNVKPWEDTFPETLLPAYIERIKHADKACRATMLNQK